MSVDAHAARPTGDKKPGGSVLTAGASLDGALHFGGLLSGVTHRPQPAVRVPPPPSGGMGATRGPPHAVLKEPEAGGARKAAGTCGRRTDRCETI